MYGKMIHTINARVDFSAQRFEMHEEISSPGDEIRQQFITSVVNARDAKTRECLLQLGWTPPAEDLAAMPEVLSVESEDGAILWCGRHPGQAKLMRDTMVRKYQGAKLYAYRLLPGSRKEVPCA